MRKKAFSLALILLFGHALLPIPAGTVPAGSNSAGLTPLLSAPAPSISFIQIGLTGGITADILAADLDGDGEKETILGTSKGLYIISQGSLRHYIPTSSFVTNVTLLDDVTGDGQPDIAIAVGDIYFPNIRCYSGATAKKVWQFAPKQEVFIENLMWTDQQTLTFDLIALDVNSDKFSDIIATSGYFVYALDGRTGSELWKFESINNLWRVVVTPDLDKDGVPDLAVGSQIGYIYVFSGKDGSLLWRERVAEKYEVIDDKGGIRAVVDRSVWDIVPLKIKGKPKAIVSSEDGKVRLIDLKEGTIEWESRLIEYVEALVYKYYRQKWKKPTSPGDDLFFNLRVSLVPDVTGDGIEEILALTYTGRRRGGEEAVARRSGMFLLNAASGRVLWKNVGLDLSNVGQVETTSVEGKQVLLLPQGKSGSTEQVEVIDLEDGAMLDTIEIKSGPESLPRNVYRVKQSSEDAFLMTSDYGDLLCFSLAGEVIWDYPRITEAAVEWGDFVGDKTQDILIRSKVYPRGDRDRLPLARVLFVIDGATRKKAWSYEMPYEEFAATGGINGVLVTPDLNGDGKQDIAGFIQPLAEDRQRGFGEGSRIMALSGKDGSVLLKQPVVKQTYYGVWEEIYKDSSLVEQRLRERFETEQMGKDFPREWKGHEQEKRQEFEPWLEEELAQRRREGWSQGRLAEFEREQRQRLERELREEKEHWERDWRRNFQEKHLPRELEEWEKRLKEEEEEGTRINKRILSLDVIQNRNENWLGFVVGCERDIFILGLDGELYWTRTYEPWRYDDPFTGERHEEMALRLVREPWESCYRTLGDLNGDGIDDLAVFSNREIVTATSKVEDGRYDFTPTQTIELEHGWDPRQGRVVDDLDGDGIKEILYLKHRENQPPLAIFVSPTTGKKLLEVEYEPGNVTLGLARADFDGDGYKDTLKFRRWAEEGPRLEILSGRARNVLWGFAEFREERLFRAMNYYGPIMPAAPVSDISGDGVADLALVKNLTWQPGAQVVIYDISNDKVVKTIVLEEINPGSRRDQRWHPSFLAKEVGDFNGDGSKELAVITALGDTEEKKEAKLMVIDVQNDEVIADFGVMGLEFLSLGRGGEFGVVGLSGELYFLNVANDLQITAPAEGSTQGSPLRIEWAGVEAGAFNQVFLDGIEVGQTNENEFILPVAQGAHELKIRSLDEYGRGVYQTVKFRVEKESTAATWAIVLLVVLVLIALWPALSGFVIRYRRRRAHHG